MNDMIGWLGLRKLGLAPPASQKLLTAESDNSVGQVDPSAFAAAGHDHTGVYDPAGSAAAAQSAAESTAAAALSSHESDTTNVHGIADTSALLTTAAIGVSVQAYDADIATVAASQAEAEAGTEAALRSFSPARIKQAVDALGLRDYEIQVALSPNATDISSGTGKGWARVPFAGTIQSVIADCDPSNEPSAISVQVDCNKVDRSTGTATSVLSAVATIATGENTGSGTVNGTQSVSAGDLLRFDVDQGSDGRELLATVIILRS